jgi:hypothetical protein
MDATTERMTISDIILIRGISLLKCSGCHWIILPRASAIGHKGCDQAEDHRGERFLVDFGRNEKICAISVLSSSSADDNSNHSE